MTAIAYKDGVLVGDSLLCWESGNLCYRAGLCDKVHKYHKDGQIVYWAESGDCQEAGAYIESLFEFINAPWGTTFKDPFPDDETAGIACYGGRVLDIYANATPVVGLCAKGTGKTFALGVMEYGGTAIDAVATAIELDVYSGYPIQGFNVRTGEEIFIANKEKYTRLRDQSKLSKNGLCTCKQRTEVPKLGAEDDPQIPVS